MHVLVSRNRDGQLIGAMMRGFGLDLVHGSTAKVGAKGQRAEGRCSPGCGRCCSVLAAGDQVVITPGWSAGAAPGCGVQAWRSWRRWPGVPVVPCAAQSVRRRVLPTWDQMLLPLPYGRGVLVCGAPLHIVPRAGWADALPTLASRADPRSQTRLTRCAGRDGAEHDGPGLARCGHGCWRPGLRAMLRRRVRRGKEAAARLGEREGFEATPRPPGKLLWVHAASVGESMSVLPVLANLAARTPAPTLLVTTGTVTSAGLMARQPHVLHRFVPLDVPGWAARFLDHWRPDAGAFVESELWPNILAAARARGVPMLLLNARMSERSAQGWSRAPGLAREALGTFRAVLAQSDGDAARLRALGAQNVSAPGNLKLAAPPLPVDEAELARLRALIGARPAWLAASTHDGEEAVAGEVHRALQAAHPGLLTIIAPRHPERGAAVASLLGAGQRSQGADPTGGVWVADTLGELGLLYRLAPVVFVGKSLVGQDLSKQGGQNVWEPARLRCAVAVGPHTANFAGAVAALQEAGGLQVVADAAALTAWVDATLRDPARRTAMQDAAARAVAGDPALPRLMADALWDALQ